MAKDSEKWVRRNLAANPHTPVAILEIFSKDEDSDVRSRVAGHSSTPVAILEILSKDEDIYVRSRVARRSSTPVGILDLLAQDRDSVVLQGLAENPSTPVAVREEVLMVLSKDPSEQTWRRVAENPSTPVAILEVLAKDKDSGVRSGIANNPRTPSDLLEKLAKDKTAEVLLGVVRNPQTPLSALLPLTASKSVSVREALAKHAHRSEEIRRKLWQDPSEEVRRAVLRNSDLDQAMLDNMVADIEWEKDAVALLEHPNLSAHSAQVMADKLLNTLANDGPWYQHELTKAEAEVAAAANAQAVLSYFGKDPNKAVLAKRPLAPIMALCAGPFVEPSRIVKVAGSTDWLVRAAVARNPGTPPALMKKLMADAHPMVALLAKTRTQHTENPPAKDLTQSEAAVDLARAIKEVTGRVPCAEEAKIFRGPTQHFFTDDVWVEQLNAGLIAWMTARMVHSPRTVLPISEFPQMQTMLDPERSALMFELAVSFERASESLGSRARKWAAADSLCPVHVLRDLANEEDPDIVLAALGNTAFPDEEKALVHNRLLKLRGERLLKFLQNKAVPSEVLLAKATSKDRSVRQAIAKNPSAPVAILEALSKDEDNYVRRSVATNPSTPVDILKLLSKDKDPCVPI